MANATTTSNGEIRLAGDLTGTADAPLLITVNTTPGTFSNPSLTVDTKGRVTRAAPATPASLVDLIPNATRHEFGVVKIGENISIVDSAVQGNHTIDFDRQLTMEAITGLCDNGSFYHFDYSLNGAAVKRVSLRGSDLTTVSEVITNINAKIAPASLSLVDGNLLLQSDAIGPASTIAVTEDNLFKYIINFKELLIAKPGMGASTIYIEDASNTTKGVARFNPEDFKISTAGEVSLTPFDLATTTSPGIATVGDGLAVTGNGVVSVVPIPDASTTVKGLVRTGYGINNTGGVISVSDATATSKGVVQAGANLAVTDGVMTTAFGDASKSAKGIAQIGPTLNVSNGVIDIPIATATIPGVAKIGPGLNVDETGNVTVNDELPIATTTTAGVVQVGSGLDITPEGVLSVVFPPATTTEKGVVQPGTNLAVDGAGVLSASFPNATTTDPGLVQVGSGLTINGSVLAATPTPLATSTVPGLVKLGPGLVSSNGAVTAAYPIASATNPGLVRPGQNLAITGNGVLSANLPIATTDTPGLIRPGNNLTVDANGVLSLTIPPASTTVAGIVKVGAGLVVDDQGEIAVNVPDASTTTKGLMQVGSGLTVSNGVVSVPLASSTTPGLVKSGDTGFMTITNGVIAAGPDLVRKDTFNLFTRTQVTALVQVRVGEAPSAGSGLTIQTTVTLDFSLSNVFKIELQDSTAQAFTIYAPTNIVAGGRYVIILQNRGSAPRFINWDPVFKFPPGTDAANMAASTTDILQITAITGGTLLVTLSKGFVQI